MLRLVHPGPASVPCCECKKWIYDLETGEVSTYVSGSPDNRLPQPRIGPPPCEISEGACPKKHHSLEHLHTLSVRNERMLLTFLDARATQGRSITEPPDELTRRAFRVLDGIYRQVEKSEATMDLLKIIEAARRQ